MTTATLQLIVRDTAPSDLMRVRGNGIRYIAAWPSDHAALAASCVTVALGANLVAIWRTDDYPGEVVWAKSAVHRDIAERAIDVWCDLTMGALA
jgi:hypothetical protein